MKTISMFYPATLAACAVLLLGGTASVEAQANQAPRESTGAKTTQPRQPKGGMQADNQALTRAHEVAINQAQTLGDYIDQNQKQLNRATINRYTEVIGRALDDAQQRRQALEASVPPDSKAADQFKKVREHEQNAAEHYRALVQQAAKTNPDADDLKDATKGIASELKDAEAAHRKTFSDNNQNAKTAPRHP